jgi:hypothetical protein
LVRRAMTSGQPRAACAEQRLAATIDANIIKTILFTAGLSAAAQYLLVDNTKPKRVEALGSGLALLRLAAGTRPPIHDRALCSSPFLAAY